MDLTTLIIVILCLAVGVALFLRGVSRRQGHHPYEPSSDLDVGGDKADVPRWQRNHPYQRRSFLLSKAEFSFFGALRQAVGEDGVVFAKVRVADVIMPAKGLKGDNWWGAFRSISQKHFDFLVCDQTSSKVLGAIELDDASHNKPRAKTRDEFLKNACKAAELPLIRVSVDSGYNVADLRMRLVESGAVEVPKSMEASAGMVQGEGTPTRKSMVNNPQCPRCGADTVLRMAKSGPHAGQQFWGCSTYPKCRGSVSIPQNA